MEPNQNQNQNQQTDYIAIPKELYQGLLNYFNTMPVVALFNALNQSAKPVLNQPDKQEQEGE